MWGAFESRLVADWRTISKFWSVRMNAIGVVIYPLLISVQALPPEAQAVFPLKYRAIAAGIYAMASLFTRIVIQPKLNAAPAAR
jgi:hypothetical protein